MKPFNGRCEMPEREVEHGVITIASKRSGHNYTIDSKEFKCELPQKPIWKSEGKTIRITMEKIRSCRFKPLAVLSS